MKPARTPLSQPTDLPPVDVASPATADDAAPATPPWWGIATALVCAGLALQQSGANQALMQLVHARTWLPEGLWSVLTLLGFGWPLLIIGCALDRGPGRPIAVWLHLVWLSALLTHLPKWWLATPRPAGVLPASVLQFIGEPVHRIGSLPSGHALAATAALTVWWFTSQRLRLGGRPALGVLAGMAAAVAWSRVAVGAHWPADVLSGAGLGLIAGLLALRAEAAWPLAPRLTGLSGQRLVAALELGAGAAWLMTHTGYPLANTLQGMLVALAFSSGLWRWRSAAVAGAAQVERVTPPLGRPPEAAL